MKRLFSLLTISCITSMMFADVMALDPATVLADTAKYAQADYTVPSYTEYLVAKEQNPCLTKINALRSI